MHTCKSQKHSFYRYKLFATYKTNITDATVKVTIRPEFYGTVPIFNDISRKKSQFSRDAHLSLFDLVTQIFCLFAHLCSRMLMHQWPKISSDFICIYEKLLAAGALPRTPLGSSQRSPIPQVALAPYDAQIMVTLATVSIVTATQCITICIWTYNTHLAYDTIRYSRLTFAQKLTRWPAWYSRYFPRFDIQSHSTLFFWASRPSLRFFKFATKLTY